LVDLVELLIGYLSLGHRPGGDGRMRDMWQDVLQPSLQTGSSGSPSDFHVFFLIAFLGEAIIRSITIMVCINFVITTSIKDNNSIINNYDGRLQDLDCS